MPNHMAHRPAPGEDAVTEQVLGSPAEYRSPLRQGLGVARDHFAPALFQSLPGLGTPLSPVIYGLFIDTLGLACLRVGRTRGRDHAYPVTRVGAERRRASAPRGAVKGHRLDSFTPMN